MMTLNKKAILLFVLLIAIPMAVFCGTVYWNLKDLPGVSNDLNALSSRSDIVNAHEHFQSYTNAPKFLKAMKKIGVKKTVILGSPEATILKGREGFFGEEKYNLEVLKLANAYPDKFIAFPTINWKDPENLEKLKRYIKMGAQGLKLYNGHTYFKDGGSLRLPSMEKIYQYCEQNQIPILYHVNVGHYQEPFEGILRDYPRLKVICPHFCLSTIKSSRFEYLMGTYPNLYTDISFGHMDFLIDALKRFSKNPRKYRRMIMRHQDRILFGTDIVITSAKYKTAEWIAEVALVYRKMLELEHYEFRHIPNMSLSGLGLEKYVLDKIYSKNFEALMKSE